MNRCDEKLTYSQIDIFQINSFNENYFLVSKCLLLNITYMMLGHLALSFPFGAIF